MNHRPVDGSTTPPAGNTGAQRLGFDSSTLAGRTSLQFPRRLSYPDWERIGKQLSIISDSSAWWLGDWLVYGEKEFGTRYRLAIDKTSLDYQTLRNYAWVTRRFAVSRRRGKLSFAHHAEVAALAEKEQDLWLGRAEESGWSRNRLRRELRTAAELDRNGQVEPASPAAGVDLRLIPSREQRDRWELAARMRDSDLSEWMVRELERAAREILGTRPAETALDRPPEISALSLGQDTDHVQVTRIPD